MNTKMLYEIALILVDVANKNNVITYNQLSKRLGNQITPLNLGQPIGELSKVSYEIGLPLISVLVVNQDTHIPGDGFYRLYSELNGISEIDAMNDFQNEIIRAHKCDEWDKLLELFLGNKDKAKDETIEKKQIINKVDVHNNIKYWLIVHDINAYKENSRVLGFEDKIYNAKNIKPKDIVVYYLSGVSAIKGIYKVCDKPWEKELTWDNEHQIRIEEIIELDNELDFKPIVQDIDLFKNKERWNTHIQGTNAVRELSYEDYKKIEEYVNNFSIENNDSNYIAFKEDHKELVNETKEVTLNRIIRYQKIVSNLKSKYKSKCQIEGCNFTFRKKNGEYYSEGHHIEFLSQGGSQDESNVVILCPNHHRMFHYADVEIFEREDERRKIRINGDEKYILYKLEIKK
jgi:Predicted restriction endonuclease